MDGWLNPQVQLFPASSLSPVSVRPFAYENASGSIAGMPTNITSCNTSLQTTYHSNIVVCDNTWFIYNNSLAELTVIDLYKLKGLPQKFSIQEVDVKVSYHIILGLTVLNNDQSLNLTEFYMV